MKTVFKVGMKVYDQINFPDMEGKVVKIHEDESKYPLGVCFNKKMSIHYYDLEGCFRKENIPTLSTKPYKIEFQGFEQKAPVPTFEDAIKWLQENNKYDVSISDDSTVTYFTKKENYSAFEALRKLVILRDYYNEGWEPDWEDEEEKFSIQVCEGEFHTFESIECQRVVSFKTEEIRDKFLEDQRELLEIAKPLL